MYCKILGNIDKKCYIGRFDLIGSKIVYWNNLVDEIMWSMMGFCNDFFLNKLNVYIEEFYLN